MEPKCTLFKIFVSVLGIFSGISILICFGYYHNINAAAWGLISAAFAAICTRLHVSYRKKVLHMRYTPESLRMFKWVGVLATFVTLVAAVTYFALVAILKEGYKLDGYMPAGIFATMTLKFTISLIFAGKTYEMYLKNYDLFENELPSSEHKPKQYSSVECSVEKS